MSHVEFRSFNFPNHFIRHRNFLGELTRKEGPRDDFVFALIPRGQGRVVLRSKNFPKRFLRHRHSRIRLEQPNGPDDQLFLKDSTFLLVPGLADPRGISFESLNFREHYLRHRNFSLFLDPKDSPNLAPDATFFRQPLSVPIDEGTRLNPVDD